MPASPAGFEARCACMTHLTCARIATSGELQGRCHIWYNPPAVTDLGDDLPGSFVAVGKAQGSCGMSIERSELRNIAIIAHVDHGKTTLVAGMLHQARGFRE